MENKPVVGKKIYVPTELFVYRGRDDFEGGIATIKKIETNKFDTMVEVEEHPGVMYSWDYICENQELWKERYGNDVAHPDPDYREEFNDSEADWHQ